MLTPTGDRDVAPAFEIVDGRIVSPEGCEINVALHCNLSCQSCAHLSPVFKPESIDPDTLATDLSILATAYRCAFVKLLGGEPVLHRDLRNVIDAVRASGVSDWVILSTNGRLLDRIDDDVWSRINEVDISMYPGREPDPDVLSRAISFARDHNVRVHGSTTTHFRESYSEIGTQDEILISQIFQTCKVAHLWRCHTIHNGHFFRCPQSAFLPIALDGAGDDFADAVPLAPADGLFERLYELLTSVQPLAACGRCLGSVGRLLPHRQVPRREWRQFQSAPTEGLLDRDQLRALRADLNADDGCVARHQVFVEGCS